MKLRLLLILPFMLGGFLIAQDTDITQDTEIAQNTDTTYWKYGAVGTAGFTNTGQTVYWQAGGINSQSISGRIDVNANYEKGKITWQNDLILALGAIRQGTADEAQFIKNQDRIELTSKAGTALNPKVNLAALLGFRTQFLQGFVFPANEPTIVPSDTVSNFLSPAYLEFGVGLDYNPTENISIYYSPVTAKITIVSIEEYRPLYIPQDVTTGPVRFEVGSKLGIKLKQQLAENILFTTNANFFTNYLQDFPTVDVNWETLTTAKVNDWFAVSFATNLIYDKDILFNLVDEGGVLTGEQGPNTQFQHILTLGLTYSFF